MYTNEEKAKFLKAYRMQKSNARTRKIPFLLTFEEWLTIWNDSGKLAQRGRGANKFCMCRIGDTGPYVIGNVFIGTGRENVRAGNLGKEMTQEVRNKISKSNIGKPHEWSRGEKNPMHRPEVKAKMKELIGGANHYKAMGVTTPQGFFPTAKIAAEAMGIKKPTVEWRARHKKFGFSYGNNLAIA
jgi:NUMOD3 motif